jgi:transaldolase (EC 2.2.1.2)
LSKTFSSNHGARVNVTLIFSADQAILADKAGATYVRPFVGRLNDNSMCGIDLIKEINAVYKAQEVRSTHILSASIRNVRDVIQSYHYGADIVTMPPKVFDEM